jgi:hypothetical protein
MKELLTDRRQARDRDSAAYLIAMFCFWLFVAWVLYDFYPISGRFPLSLLF